MEATGRISMTLEQMNMRAGEVRREGDAFQEVITRMQGIVENLQSEWQGDASAAFNEQFFALKPSLDRTRNLFIDIAKQLDDAARITQQYDQDIARSIRGGIGG